MTNTVDYVPIANNVGANVESQAQYLTDLAGGGSLVNGYQAGLAQSAQINKTLRQSSMIASALATFISNKLNTSILDDGNLSSLVTNMTNAIMGSENFFTAGTSTGSANAQVLASLTPATGFSLSNNGQTVVFTAGFTNTGATTLAITSPAITATAVKKQSGASIVPLTGGEIQAGGTYYASVNTTSACFVLTEAPPLGALAALGAGTNLNIAAGNLNNGNLRQTMTANLSLFVATTGSDSANGLSSGAPFLTIQHAVNIAYNNYDLNGFTITINVADGTYTNPVVISSPFVGSGSGSVLIQGNLATPSNCIISTTSNTAFIVQNEATVTIAGFKIQTTTSGNCIFSQTGANVTLGNIVFGACASAQVITSQYGIVNFNSNYSITGGAQYHIAAATASSINYNGITCTVTGTPAFSQAFASALNTSLISAGGSAFTGAATGARYVANLNGVVNTSGGGANFFPGSSAGSTATGGQYA